MAKSKKQMSTIAYVPNYIGVHEAQEERRNHIAAMHERLEKLNLPVQGVAICDGQHETVSPASFFRSNDVIYRIDWPLDYVPDEELIGKVFTDQGLHEPTLEAHCEGVHAQQIREAKREATRQKRAASNKKRRLASKVKVAKKRK